MTTTFGRLKRNTTIMTTLNDRRFNFNAYLFLFHHHFRFSTMYSFMKKREYGVLNPLRLERAETTRRAYNLQLSKSKELALSHRGL